MDPQRGTGDETEEFLVKKLANEKGQAIFDQYNRLRSKLNIGWAMSTNVDLVWLLTIPADDSSLQFSKVGKGAFGECFLVETTENSLSFLKELVQEGFIVKKLTGGEENEIYKEAARLLLITSLGHYGLVGSHTFEKDGKNIALVLCQNDPSQSITVYVTMKNIAGKTLQEALDQKELTDYDKLRIVVRVADTLNFLHSYKLAHCDLNFSNIMLTQESHDPVLIDFGSMRNNVDVDFTSWDTSSYHAMIYKMYENCSAAEIPPVVKPLFDKWDDPEHCQMTIDTLAAKYFGELSAYNTICRISTGAGLNIIPCRRVTGMYLIDVQAVKESKSFVEYFEQAGMKLEIQDERIKKYSDFSRETKNEHTALKPPFKWQIFYQQFLSWPEEIMKLPQLAEEGQS